MRWWQKKPEKKLPKPTYYDVKEGELVELTMVGRLIQGQVETKGHSYFKLGAGLIQIDPDVNLKRIEKN